MRRIFEEVYGNEAIKASLAAMIKNQAIPHAMIFTGPRGSGKHLLAREFASALLCQAKEEDGRPLPCGSCPACQKIKAGQCPDITYVTPEEGKSQITVEKIRALRADMVLAANDSDYKIYILEAADEMNAAAQNALLISLEEPPRGVILLLLCEHMEKLLPTVKSRCQTLSMSLFEPEALDAFLQKTPKGAKLAREDPARYAVLLESCGGCLGVALSYMEGSSLNKILKQREVVDRLLGALRCKRPSALYEAFTDLPGEKRNELSELLALLLSAVRDLILLKRSEKVKLSYFYDRALALELADGIGLRRLLSFADTLDATLYDLSRNANTTLLLHTMISALHTAL